MAFIFLMFFDTLEIFFFLGAYIDISREFIFSQYLKKCLGRGCLSAISLCFHGSSVKEICPKI